MSTDDVKTLPATMEWTQLDHVISDPFLSSIPTSGPLDVTTPIFELGLHFDVNYTPVKVCDCVLNGWLVSC